MFLNTDYTKEIPKPSLYLCLPNKKIIYSMNEIEAKIDYKLNALDSVSFSIPVFIEKDNSFIDSQSNKVIKNPLIDVLMERYLIKINHLDDTKWFLITKTNKNVNEKDSIEVIAESLEVELKDKKIDFKTVSSNIRQILCGNELDENNIGVLYKTGWTLGYLDDYFSDIYREFNFNGDVLQCLTNMSETFNAIIKYDTENKLINIYSKFTFGKNTGITFDYRKYLKSFSKSIDASSEVLCTRLKCYGKDNLTFNEINPTGQPYIDDFSYFMYPFEMDRQGNILKHSNYMSDELCLAIVDYKIKINSYKNYFRKIINKKSTYNKVMIYKKTELSNLINQKDIFMDKYMVALISGNSTEDITKIKKDIEFNITVKENEIKDIENDLNNIKDEINYIITELSEENNFSNHLLEELNTFIIEDTWTDTRYIDPEDLYRDGIKELKNKCKPKSTFSIDYVDFLSFIEEQNTWGKINIGDKINISYPLLNINETIMLGKDDSMEVGEY